MSARGKGRARGRVTIKSAHVVQEEPSCSGLAAQVNEFTVTL